MTKVCKLWENDKLQQNSINVTKVYTASLTDKVCFIVLIFLAELGIYDKGRNWQF